MNGNKYTSKDFDSIFGVSTHTIQITLNADWDNIDNETFCDLVATQMSGNLNDHPDGPLNVVNVKPAPTRMMLTDEQHAAVHEALVRLRQDVLDDIAFKHYCMSDIGLAEDLNTIDLLDDLLQHFTEEN